MSKTITIKSKIEKNNIIALLDSNFFKKKDFNLSPASTTEKYTAITNKRAKRASGIHTTKGVLSENQKAVTNKAKTITKVKNKNSHKITPK